MRIDLIKVDIVQSFKEYNGEFSDKKIFLVFIEKELEITNLKTKKTASAFFKKYGK